MGELKVGVDTSCLVPLMSSWHPHHEATIQALEELKRQKARLITASQAVIECFSVLTRLPDRIRISPREAYERMRENLSENFRVVGLDPNVCWMALDAISARELGGGLIYDAIIAHCCAQAGATILLTWNVQDYARVAPAGLSVQNPLS
jgi:predicted nucleic acid-binding protein